MTTQGRRAVCAVVVAISAAWALCLVLLPTETKGPISNVGLIVAPLAAALQCFWRARTVGSGSRRAWMLIGAACASWSLGQTVWTWYETVLGKEVPFPSAADVGYLLLVPLAVAGLLAFPSAPSRLSSRVRAVLDGLIIATSLLIVSWTVVLGTLVSGASDGILALVISVAYPLGDVVILTILLLSSSRRSRMASMQWSTGLLALGLIAFAISDSGFTYLTSSGSYNSGDLIDLGWFAGFALVFVAAMSAPETETEKSEDETVELVAVFLPYVPVLIAVATSAYLLATENELDAVLGGAALMLLVLAVFRQVAALLENVSLTRNLEHRVIERTEQLHSSEQRFRSLVQNSSDLVTVIDAEGAVRYQSPSIHHVLGHDDSADVSIIDLLHPDDQFGFMNFLAMAMTNQRTMSTEVRLQHGAGHWSDTEVVVTNSLADESVAGLVLNTRDISERKQLERQLSHQAFHDDLTGLANRALFRDRVNHALNQASRRQTLLAVLFLDLDGFKRVNDTLGHEAGDRLLVELGARLSTCIRSGETISRLSGDEFGVLIEELVSESEATAVAERIMDVLRSPIVVCNEEVFMSASIGIAFGYDNTISGEDLLRNADLAMYKAKAENPGGYCRYESEMHSALVERVALERDLRLALERQEFFVEYQPIIDVDSLAFVGVEALVRWLHPTRGVVPPLDFIPAAESNGMIVDIGRLVLAQACADGRRWRDEVGDPFTIAVNLSVRQLQRSDFVSVVANALRDADLDPAALVLEITESVLIDEADEALRNLTELRELGVAVAIDDFGTGYSSLSNLHHFPIDILKIDRSFVRRLSNSDEPGLARSIIGLGRELGLRTVAEGVEDSTQLGVLGSLGCDEAQGFLFSKPEPADVIDAQVARRRSAAEEPVTRGDGPGSDDQSRKVSVA
jgi:diguanylate cyclase (GGDEF)-like protein/PAS domain S-box-containing protein